MARLLYRGRWFDQASSHDHYEREFERILEQHAHNLFDTFHFVPFKCTVSSPEDGDSRRADYALIDKCYRSWWIVEVEMAHHSLKGHVLPQVRTLSRATYGVREVRYLCSRNDALEEHKMEELSKGQPPRVLVVVNAPVQGWGEELKVFDALVAICQVFRSDRNEYLLRVNGELPKTDEEVLTTCACNLAIDRLLEIHSPASLKISPNETVPIHYDGQVSTWQRMDTGNSVFLHALRGHNLVGGKQYEIVRRSDGRLALR